MNPTEFKFHCPECLGSISAGPEWRGQVTVCPHCGESIRVPGQTPPLDSFAPAPTVGARIAEGAKARKPFFVTVAAILIVFASVQWYWRTKPESMRESIPSSPPEYVHSDDPFVLSDGYHVQNLEIERRGSDGKIYKLRDSESYQAFMREERARSAEANSLGSSDDGEQICSFCKGTGRNQVFTSSRCPRCSGGGTHLTPSGHRIVCNECGGTGNAKHDPDCAYCHGTGRLGLPGQ